MGMGKLLTLFVMLLANRLGHSQDVTSFAYGPFDPNPNPNDLIYEGGAHVPEGASYLRLTQTDSSGNPLSWNVGRVLHSWPVQFWEDSRQATFETTITFLITPSAQGAADGLVFFIAPPNAIFDQTSSGENFGIFNGSAGGTAPSVFAVEFDTFINRGRDPSYRHIGIDIESINSMNTTQFDSATGQLVNARINYDANTKTISVVASSGSQRASVRYVFDLKTILPQQVEVGISSSTGQSVSQLGIHDLISWYFTSSLVHDTYIRQYV